MAKILYFCRRQNFIMFEIIFIYFLIKNEKKIIVIWKVFWQLKEKIEFPVGMSWKHCNIFNLICRVVRVLVYCSFLLKLSYLNIYEVVNLIRKTFYTSYEIKVSKYFLIISLTCWELTDQIKHPLIPLVTASCVLLLTDFR